MTGCNRQATHVFCPNPHLIFSAGAAPIVRLSRYATAIATRNDAFENRHGSVLGRGAALPLGKSSRPRSGRRGDAGRVVGPAEAAVPPQPCEHLSARRRRRLGDGGFRLRQRGIDRGLDRAVRGPARACEDHPADRDPFASRPCRPRGMDRRALQLPAPYVAGRISAVGLSSEPRHRRTQARRSGCSSAVTAWTRT